MPSLLLGIVHRGSFALALWGLALGSAAAAGVPNPAASATADPAPGYATPLNPSTRELDVFRKTWDGLTNYSETIVAHETSNDGKHVEDRTYRYAFVKPQNALIVITAGPGRGGGVAWHGGPTVRGHKGGLLSMIKLTLSKNDPQVVSLRGDTVEDASFGHELDRYATIPGTLVDGKAADGSPTVTLVPTSPEASGVTREMLTFARNGLPSKREQFVRERSVKVETFTDVKIDDPKLTVADIEI